jgi:N12 class adenine-specific DNA methylase
MRIDGKDFIMRDHQKNAVARGTLGGNTLVAHVVGAGKSAVMFATIMKKKELGLIDKACVVVPKPLTEQTADEWRKLYPDARLLTVTNEDLASEDKRKLFTAKVATGTYDAVILSREQFEKIPMSREHRVAFMNKQLDELNDMIKERKRENNGQRDPTTKQIELARKRLQAKLDKLTDPKGARPDRA